MQQNELPYHLVDCNQFFVSCEQVFNPALIGKPVVVLSSNDGCVVARSKEAKALGIPMGAAAYQCADLFKAQKVHVFSSNFSLYGDMSQRVMQILHSFSNHVEEYSVDEAFLLAPPEDAPEIRKRVLQWTGIPVSIGIGKTKTLTKVAGDLAKKHPSGVLELSDEKIIDAHLAKLPTSEIWGVGSRLSQALREDRIYTALQLKNASDLWIKKRFSVVLLRTVFELRGISCLSLEEVPEVRKSLTCSRSFGERVTELADLEEAVSSYVASAAEKLRREELSASVLTVFITTSPFLKPPNYYANALTLTLAEATNYTPLLISCAKEALHQIYRKGFLYKKAGIVLNNITLTSHHQPDFFSGAAPKDAKRQKVMDLMDELNVSGDHLFFAAEGLKKKGEVKKWQSQKVNCTKRYTSNWDELLTINI